jgi:F0F1-type ATP synthase delta subunit
MSRQTLAQRFAKAEINLAEAQRQYDRVRSEHFLDRRRRAARGEELEQLICSDSNAWNQQLNIERLARNTPRLTVPRD